MLRRGRPLYILRRPTVGVAQLVEPRVVIPVVVGSSPIVHPKSGLGSTDNCGPLAQLVEQLTLNQLVVGSNPTRPTNWNSSLQRCGLLFSFAAIGRQSAKAFTSGLCWPADAP